MEGDSSGQWLTKSQLAEVRGISRASADRLSRRHRWQRQKGNDGQARIFVPSEWLARADDRADDRADIAQDIPADASADRLSRRRWQRQKGNNGQWLALADDRADARADNRDDQADDQDDITQDIPADVSSDNEPPDQPLVLELRGQIADLKGQVASLTGQLDKVTDQLDKERAAYRTLAEKVADRLAERPARKRWWPFRRRRQREEAAKQEN